MTDFSVLGYSRKAEAATVILLGFSWRQIISVQSLSLTQKHKVCSVAHGVSGQVIVSDRVISWLIVCSHQLDELMCVRGSNHSLSLLHTFLPAGQAVRQRRPDSLFVAIPLEMIHFNVYINLHVTRLNYENLQYRGMKRTKLNVGGLFGLVLAQSVVATLRFVFSLPAACIHVLRLRLLPQKITSH